MLIESVNEGKLLVEDSCYVDAIHQIVFEIKPFDDIERHDQQDILHWIRSGETLCRYAQPDKPYQHLVSCFVVMDMKTSSILMVNHKKAGCWLPTAGHVEPNELPLATVKRELYEELKLTADFWAEQPVFITKQITSPMTGSHCDVSLWFVLKARKNADIFFDRDEFFEVKWMTFHEASRVCGDANFIRFLNKWICFLQD